MKNKLFTISITIAVFSLIISVATFYFLFKKDLPHVVKIPNDLPSHQATNTTTTTNEPTEWKTYENIKYGYKFEYPSDVNLQKIAEMERGGVDESKAISLGLPGFYELIDIYAEDLTNMLLSQQLEIGISTNDNLDVFVDSYVKAKRSDSNLFIDSVVSNPEDYLLASFKAYIVNVKETSSEYAEQDALDKKTPFISLNRNFNLLFVETSNGEKLVVRVYKREMAEKIMESFEFVE